MICSVCGYTPAGEAVPGTCPVCGADGSRFQPADDAVNTAPLPESAKGTDGQWQCDVCKYAHSGPLPTDPCPVCGAPADRFSSTEPSPAATVDPLEPADTQWRCVVCGYIHTGPAPPEICPVCGADASKFEKISESAESKAKPVPTAKSKSATTDMDQQWRCEICGYIHVGAEPPDRCPVCSASKEKFKLVPLEPAPKNIPKQMTYTEPQARLLGISISPRLSDLLVQYHAHPIAVHIPNGLAPVAVAFLILAMVFDMPTLESAAILNMVVVALAMPAVILSGVHDWLYRFRGAMTPVFRTKITCAIIVWGISIGVVVWRWLLPNVVFSEGPDRWLYLGLHLVMFVAAAVAGFMGGKLVFGPSKK